MLPYRDRFKNHEIIKVKQNTRVMAKIIKLYFIVLLLVRYVVRV